MFQFTRPRRARSNLSVSDSTEIGASINVPGQGLTASASAWSSSPVPFQSTRPVGRNAVHFEEYIRLIISIHALIQGATIPLPAQCVYKRIVSIHALIQGATRAHRHRQRRYNTSIHAPAQGDLLDIIDLDPIKWFQPMRPCRARQCDQYV